MNTIKTITAKNEQTYYYISGKRISRAKALSLMAQVETATPANDEPQADAQALIMPSSLPRIDYIIRQTDYIKRCELLAQRTYYTNKRADKARATLRRLGKVSALLFSVIVVIALMGLASPAVTITSISAVLVATIPLLLLAYRSHIDAVDKIRSEREQCLLKIGVYAEPGKHLSAFMRAKVGNSNYTRLLPGI